MKPWAIIKTHNDYETHIILPEFGETYFGDVDTMTPEEWRIVHMISATPMLLAACKRARQELEHSVPDDCWSTGPLTGDVIADHITCPGCAVIAQIDKAIAQAEEAQ